MYFLFWECEWTTHTYNHEHCTPSIKGWKGLAFLGFLNPKYNRPATISSQRHLSESGFMSAATCRTLAAESRFTSVMSYRLTKWHHTEINFIWTQADPRWLMYSRQSAHLFHLRMISPWRDFQSTSARRKQSKPLFIGCFKYFDTLTQYGRFPKYYIS
jgi:hypothetical protein